MRIGLVVAGGFDRSGRERVTPALLSLVEELSRRHDVHVFVLDYYATPCTYPLAGATVHDVGGAGRLRGLRRLRQRARLARAIAAAGGVEIVHAYMGVPAGLAAVHAGRDARIPVVVTFDSGELVAIDDIGYGLQRRWLDRHGIETVQRLASRVTVSTEYMRKQPALRVAADVVPIGVDAAAFATPARPTDGPPWRLLRVASLNRVKDHPTLLRAFRAVLDRLQHVHLDIVGEDTLDGSIQAFARTLGLGPHVTFHGVQPTERVAAFYANAHLHVSASRHEAAGVAVLEAACAGLPTVGTRVGIVADWIADSESERAIGVAVEDPVALADAIAALLNDPRRRSRIAASARAWAMRHDSAWTAHRFEEIYADVLRAAAGSR